MRRVLAAVAIFMISYPAVAEMSPDHFRVGSAQDFVDLCSADPQDPNYVAAIHFCHGFASGAYHYYKIQEMASPSHRFVCAPTPTPTRTETINGYLGWMRNNPKYLSDPAVDTIFRYLAEAFPCPSK